jgi:hypothetical protein
LDVAVRDESGGDAVPVDDHECQHRAGAVLSGQGRSAVAMSGCVFLTELTELTELFFLRAADAISVERILLILLILSKDPDDSAIRSSRFEA